MSLNMLKTYLAKVILIMICHFIQKNVDKTIYIGAIKTKRMEWQNAILTNLHMLDRITVDLDIISESEITLA